MRELRSVCFVTRLIEEQEILDKDHKAHAASQQRGKRLMQAMSVGSKNADWELVNKLMKVGCERADTWIAVNFDRLGEQSTTDIHKKYL